VCIIDNEVVKKEREKIEYEREKGKEKGGGLMKR
jgi:hypothetical protein